MRTFACKAAKCWPWRHVGN